MSRSSVQKTVWESVTAPLRQGGFEVDAAVARQYSPSQVSVIRIQWFAPTMAKRLGGGEGSFSVRLGCFLRFIPQSPRLESVDGRPQPDEAHCHVRRTLFRSFNQPAGLRKDIWCVGGDHANLDRTVPKLVDAITTDAMAWLKRYSDLREILRILSVENENESKAFGFGRDPSPIRYLYRGFVALEVGEKATALKDLERALDSGRFGTIRSEIEAAIAKAS